MNIEHRIESGSRGRGGILKSRLRTAIPQAALLGLIAISAALAVNHLRPNGIPLNAVWSPEARLAASGGAGMVIPLSQAFELHQAGKAVFVDARPQGLYRDGHISGALNVPWQQVNDYMGAFLDRVPDAETPVIAYCDGESCELSEDLAVMLLQMGYTNVKVLINGWSVWKDKGYPIEEGPGS